MAKQIKHDFKGWSEKPGNTADTGKVIQMKNVQKETSNNIAQNNALNPFALVTKNVLLEKFGMTCDIREKQLSPNFTTFHITKKGTKPEAEGQVRITVSKDLNFNIQLNPYSDEYGKRYFQGTWLDSKELVTELDNFTSFIHKGEFTEHGKFKKEVNYDPETVDKDLPEGDHKVK